MLANVITFSELDPVFVLSGPSGVGKSLLLETTSKAFGVNFCHIDCNDLISSTSAQIHANFKNAFNKVHKCLPCIVEIFNVEVIFLFSFFMLKI